MNTATMLYNMHDNLTELVSKLKAYRSSLDEPIKPEINVLMDEVEKGEEHLLTRINVVLKRIEQEGPYKSQLIDMLNKALSREYNGVFLYSRDLMTTERKDLIETLKELASKEIEHVDRVTAIINDLGGEAVWSLDAIKREEMPLIPRLTRHIADEKETIVIYENCIKMVPDGYYKDMLNKVKADEERHRHILEELVKKIQ